MGDLLDQALSPQVMNAAWKRLARDKAPWRVGEPRWEMERNLVSHLLTLIDDVRCGNYRPDGVRQFTIAKADGRRRVLSALTLRDKLLQRAVLTVLQPLGERLFHHDSFAYRPRRNTWMALSRARERIQCGLFWIVDADIRKFFDNIPHRLLRRAIRRLVADREVRKLIDGWLRAGTYHSGIVTAARGIPQGAIISPFLCNLYLHDFDEQLTSRQVPFVRFADDFLLFAPDRDGALRARRFARRRLARLGLELHPDKTQVVLAGPEVRFLGQSLQPQQHDGGARVVAMPSKVRHHARAKPGRRWPPRVHSATRTPSRGG